MVAQEREQAAFSGVLVIPKDPYHPASYSHRSRNVIRQLKDGTEVSQIYTFVRGVPARVANEADFNALREMTWYAGVRGHIRLFNVVNLTAGPQHPQAIQALFKKFMEFASDNSVDIAQLIGAAGDAERADAEVALQAIVNEEPNEAPTAVPADVVDTDVDAET